jgi:hypothetical protein
MDAGLVAQSDVRKRGLKHLLAKRIAAVQALMELRAAYDDELNEVKAEGNAPDYIALYGFMLKTLSLLDVDLKRLSTMRDYIKFNALPETFERDGIRNLTGTNGDRVTVVTDVLTSILADNRPYAYQWLRDHDHGDIITETIMPSTLAAFAKSWLIDTGNSQFPDESHIRTELRPKATFTAGPGSPNKLERPVKG